MHRFVLASCYFFVVVASDVSKEHSKQEIAHNQTKPNCKLFYFPLRGRAEPIRLLFALADVPYKDIVYTQTVWKEKKADMPFNQMPVLEVDGEMLPQTIAILRFLADQYGFGGSTPMEKAWVNAIALQSADFFADYSPWHNVNVGHASGNKGALYESAFKPARAKHFAIFQRLLKKSSSGWFVGDSITFADLMLATNVRLLQDMDPNRDSLFDGFPELKAHMEKVHTHPKLQQHIQSRPKNYPY